MAKKNEHLPPVHFVAAGATPEEKEAKLESVLPSPGFPAAIELIAEAIEKRSELSVLDFTPTQVNIRFQIDGIWHAMAAMDREKGDYMLASLKQLAGMEYRDRRSRQEGSFRADYLKRKTPCKIISQGVRTGERVAIYLEVPQPKLENLEDLGMRESMRTALAQVLSQTGAGMTLVSAMPGEGFTTAWRAVLSSCDRFTRDYYVMEEKSRVEPEVINISSVTYDESAGETPFTGMPQLLLREPQFIAFAEVADGIVLDQICDLSEKQDFPVLTRIHGKNALDGLLRLMLHKSDHEKLLDTLNAVVAMRLIRKLCEVCRVSYRPHPMMLQKLGIPPGRINQMYKPFIYQPEMVDENGKEIEICTNCHGIGYQGRTGIFELLRINDPIRQVLLSNPNMNPLMAEARKQGHVLLRDEGILLVARGVDFDRRASADFESLIVHDCFARVSFVFRRDRLYLVDGVVEQPDYADQFSAVRHVGFQLLRTVGFPV